MSSTELYKLTTADFKARRLEIEESRKYALSKVLTPHSAKLPSSVRKHILHDDDAADRNIASYSNILTNGRKRQRNDDGQSNSVAKRVVVGEEASSKTISKTLFSGDGEPTPSEKENENAMNFCLGSRTASSYSPTKSDPRASAHRIFARPLSSIRKSPKNSPKKGAAYIKEQMSAAIRRYRRPACSSSASHGASLECNCGGFKVNTSGSRGMFGSLKGRGFVEFILHFKVFAAGTSTMTTRSAASTEGPAPRPRTATVKVVLMRRYSAFHRLFEAVRDAARSPPPTGVFALPGQQAKGEDARHNRFALLDQMFPAKNAFVELPVDVSAPTPEPLLQALFPWAVSGSTVTATEAAGAAFATEEFYNQRQIDLEAWFLALLETVGAEFALHESQSTKVEGDEKARHERCPSTNLEALNKILDHVVAFLSE